jgi:hypothetical protein
LSRVISSLSRLKMLVSSLGVCCDIEAILPWVMGVF